MAGAWLADQFQRLVQPHVDNLVAFILEFIVGATMGLIGAFIMYKVAERAKQNLIWLVTKSPSIAAAIALFFPAYSLGTLIWNFIRAFVLIHNIVQQGSSGPIPIPTPMPVPTPMSQPPLSTIVCCGNPQTGFIPYPTTEPKVYTTAYGCHLLDSPPHFFGPQCKPYIPKHE